MENFTNSTQVLRDLSHDNVLKQLLFDAPITGEIYRGVRVESVFTPESEITTNAEKYNDYAFACIISVENMFYAVGNIKGNSKYIILPEIDHSVAYAGKVIFAGIV